MNAKDHLIPLLWIAFVPLAVVTAIFGPLLVIFPESTASFWSWEIQPAMSAVWVGAGYTFGAISIVTMLVVGRWRSSIVPIIATWPFAVVMLLATLLHLDRFFLGTMSFYGWLAIYVTLPVALPLIFWLNRSQDPGPQPGEMLMPASLSRGAGVVGIGVFLAGLLLIFSPSTAASFWPWQLTPLMSQVIGGWLLFAGTGLAYLLFDRRYILYRYFLLSAGTWMLILFVASFFHLGNFSFSHVGSWLWFVHVGAIAAGAFALYFYMERRYRRLLAQSPAIVIGGRA